MFLKPLTLLILLQVSIQLPFSVDNRHAISNIQLTEIGEFGLLRKARPDVPAHYHTGIDIKRPSSNYIDEPIFPIAEGIVISKRTDGPFANIIIEHTIKKKKLWSLYEHIAGVEVYVGEKVSPTHPIARFMNKEELDHYGWQFDHFHLEIIKVKPLKIEPLPKTPERLYDSYSLTCYTLNDLHKHYFNPIEFLKENL